MGLFDRLRAPSGASTPGLPATAAPRPLTPVPDVDDFSAPFEDTIREHLARLTAAAETDVDALTAEQFDAALTSRLVGAERVHATGLGFSYALPFAPHVDEVLTLDLPAAVITLPDTRLAELGRYLPTLVDLGRANLRRLLETTPVEVERITSAHGSCLAVVSDSPYTASFARFLVDALRQWLPEADTSGGVVFALPHRHAIVLQTCESGQRVREALDLVPACAAQMFDDDASPMSPHTYHWLEGQVGAVTRELADGTLQVRATPFLEDVLTGGRRRAG